MNLKKILNMPYVDFMAFIKETNRAPWWEKMLVELAKNTFMNESKKALHVACNTWSSLRELHKLTWCGGIWIDINPNMIQTANDLKKREFELESLDFRVMDGQNLDIENNSFDISFTTWGMAFVPDKPKAISEMVRITKDSWFIADIVMYYKETPPDYLINEMNNLMNINIQKRDKEFWINIYENAGLKLYYEFEWDYTNVTQEKMLNYCRVMSTNNTDLDEEEKKLVEYKLYRIMSLFAENHKYLWACLLIFRKNSINDQISLFT